MTKASNSGKSKKNSEKDSRQSSSNPLITAIVAIIVTMMTVYYALTGYDPIGLFIQPGVTPLVTDTAAEQITATLLNLEPFNTTTPTEVALTTASTMVEIATTPTAKRTPRTKTPIPKPTTSTASSNAPSGGDWWQVYFTDPSKINDPNNLKGSIPEKLIGYIKKSRKSIHISIFELDLTPIAEALIDAHQRGVDVRIITDDEHGIEADKEEGHGQFRMLKKAGIEVKEDHRTALMHHKFWIFDQNFVWTGSTNATINDNFKNNNNVIVIESPELATVYEKQFSEMWAGMFGMDSPSSVVDQTLKVKRTPIQVIFSPEDDAMKYLIPLVEGAQESIRFMAFSFTHDGLMDALLERAKAGVDVKGIFETRGSETEYSAMPPLYCAGVAVRQDGNPRTFHHKVFVIDGRILVTGSTNFTDNAIEPNNENMLLITNSTLAALYLQEFEKRWAEAKNPEPEDMKCK